MRAPRPFLMLAAAAGVCALIASGGCLFSPDTPPNVDPPPQPTKYIWPGAPDSLMYNFRTAYTSMDIDHYREALHPDFRFIFNQLDVERLNLPSSFETFADDITSTANMFSGNSIVKPDQTTVPGVSAINIQVLDRTEPWVDEGSDNPDFPNTQRATFNVAMSLARVSNATTLLISGQQMFYVSYKDSTHNGLPARYYQLRGQRDLTSITPGGK